MKSGEYHVTKWASCHTKQGAVKNVHVCISVTFYFFFIKFQNRKFNDQSQKNNSDLKNYKIKYCSYGSCLKHAVLFLYKKCM